MGTWSVDMQPGWRKKPQIDLTDKGDPIYGPLSASFSARLERKAVKTRDNNGAITDVRDLVISHDEISEFDLLFEPGADTSSDNNGRTAGMVEETPDLDGGDILWEVTL